jgi:hypothetical protein
MNECLKRTANTYRCLTARWRTLPHFLIIGAMRGGTTSLVNYLYRHPCVVRPQLPRFQEVHFFDLHYAHGPRWYRTHFPLTIRMRWLRRRRGAALTGESSPYYLYHPHAPRRAFSLVPQVRLIALLRDPVERAISNYCYLREQGWMTAESLEEALRIERRELEKETQKMRASTSYQSDVHRTFSLLRRGEYVDQLKAWMTYFSRDQLLVLQSERLYAHPAETYRTVLRFLDLPSFEPAQFAPRNARSSGTRRGRRALRERLRAHFAPHNRRLYEYLGRDFGWDDQPTRTAAAHT